MPAIKIEYIEKFYLRHIAENLFVKVGITLLSLTKIL